MSPVQRAVQIGHALVELGIQKLIPETHQHPSLVLCQVTDEDQLRLEADSLVEKGIGYVPFHEPDLGNSLTALATIPLNNKQRRLMRKAELLAL